MKVIIISITVLTLLNWTTTSASPALRVNAGNHVKGNPRTVFMNYIDGAVKQLPRSMCDIGGDSEVEWNEYCNAATQTVHTCPLVTVGDRIDFFHLYCALDLIIRKFKDQAQAPFRTRALAIFAVKLVFEKRIGSTEMCRISPSSYCRRDIEACHRSENSRGICVSPMMLCASNDHPEWCIVSRAPIYVFKQGLMTFLNETEWIERPLDSTEDLLDEKRTAGILIMEMQLMKLEMKRNNPNQQSHANAFFDFKREFNTAFQKILSSIKPQCGTKKMSWDQYSQDDSPLNCPRPRELLRHFYGQHCPLEYPYQEIGRWQEDALSSPKKMEKQLNLTMKTLPLVKWGKDKEFCYRGADLSGMCMDAKEHCSNDLMSALCQREVNFLIVCFQNANFNFDLLARIFIAQTMRSKFIEKIKANQLATSESLTTKQIFGIGFGCVAFVAIIITIIIRRKPLIKTGFPSRSANLYKMEKQKYLFITMLLPALLVSTTVNCYPVLNADISLKKEFNSTVQMILNTIKSECGTKKMNWNEYCQDDSPVKCPPWGQEPSGDFYGKHCPLAYFNQEIKQWEEDTFDSPEYIEKQLNVTLKTFPRVQCGNDDDSCPRDKQLCYRGVDASGICMDANEYCLDDPTSHLCQHEAGIFILIKKLLETIEEMKKNNPKKETSSSVTKKDVSMESEFKTGFQKILDSVKSKCNGMEMNWNEYCHDGSRLQCPDRGREPSEKFYSQHCPLVYLAREIEEWQEDTLGSPELISKRLTTTLETLPREECGNEGEWCSRDTEICYRGVDEGGICLNAVEICLSNPSSVLCVVEGGTFIVKIELMKLIENLKTNHSYPEPVVYVASDMNITNTNHIEFKTEFLTTLREAVSSIKPTCGNMEMKWYEYCQHGSPKKCPDRGQMPPSFYTKHCSLAYFKQMIERWENHVYNSPEHMALKLATTLDKLPRIPCGNEGDSCNQAEEFCYRGVDERGICILAAEYCSNDTSSHLCQNEAPIFIVKNQLEKSIEGKKEKIKHAEEHEIISNPFIIVSVPVTIFVSLVLLVTRWSLVIEFIKKRILGGYPTLDPGDRKYICQKCEKHLRNPFQSQVCGHRYCFSCLGDLLSDGNEQPCIYPGCSEMISTDQCFPDRAISRDIKKLHVKCVNNNCQWSGTIASYDEHEDSCEYRIVLCPNDGCAVPILYKEGKSHLEVCKKRAINCDFCKTPMIFDEMENHLKQCPSLPVKCPDCQTEMMNSQELEAHSHLVTGTCQNTKMRCVFSRLGCEESMVRSKLKDHLKSWMQQHIRLVGDEIIQLRETASSLSVQTVSPTSAAFEPYLERVGKLEILCQVLHADVQRSINGVETMTQEIQAIRDFRLELDRKELSIRELRWRLEMLSTISYDGSLLWAIPNVTQLRREAQDGTSTSIYSPVFFAGRHGYKLCLRLYLNGDGVGQGQYLSLFLVVLRGPWDALLPWPFAQTVTFELINQSGDERHITESFRPASNSVSFKRPVTDMNIASGCPQFCPLQVLEDHKDAFIKDDQMFLKATVNLTGLALF